MSHSTASAQLSVLKPGCQPGEWRYSRVFAHPPRHDNQHGDDDDHCQQSTDHDAGDLARAQALCGMETQQEKDFTFKFKHLYVSTTHL